MYTKPIVYKVYSFIIALSAVSAFCGTVISFISEADQIFSPFSFMSVLYLLIYLAGLAASAWLGYIEFSAMYTFADMITHELADDGTLFKRGLALPGKVYRTTGSLVFYAAMTVALVSAVVLTVLASAEHDIFIAVPVLPLIVMAAALFFINICYNCRFGAFGAVLEIKETEDPRATEQNLLLETNPNTLRAFSRILFVIVLLVVAGVIIALAIGVEAITEALSLESQALTAVLLIVGGLLTVIELSILGCFFDDLAKMQEKYLIKYHLI